jgi:hypothetical protein
MSALQHGLRRGARTVLQLVAGGALTAVVAAIVHGLAPGSEAVIMATWTAIVAALQNGLEQAGRIPTILPTPSAAAIPTASPDPT